VQFVDIELQVKQVGSQLEHSYVVPVLKYLSLQIQYGDRVVKVLYLVASQVTQAEKFVQVKQEY
jgi:hypothetical protein